VSRNAFLQLVQTEKSVFYNLGQKKHFCLVSEQLSALTGQKKWLSLFSPFFWLDWKLFAQTQYEKKMF